MRTLLALAVLSAASALAETDVTVSGRVVDAGTRDGVGLARISFVPTDSDAEPLELLTLENGRFVVSGLPHGNYRVLAGKPGYRSAESTLLVGSLNDAYDLGDITLRPDGGPVEEVVTTARRETVGTTLDRRVFDMEDNVTGSTGSLLDALRALPGVTVDQDGRVLLRGNDRVSVLTDGRFSSITGFGNQSGLDSVPAANIDRIEIINNPSAAYDTSGSAGIINVIYRQDAERGLDLSAGLTVGTGTLSKRRDDLPTELGSFSNNRKISPSLDVSHMGPRRRYFLQAEFLFQDDLPNNEFTTRFYDDGSVVLSQVPENREQEQYIVTTGIDYFIDERRTLTVSAALDFETHTDRAQVPFIDRATMTRNRYWFWREEEDTGYFNLHTEYQRTFEEPGHEFGASLTYSRGWEDESYFLNEESPVRVGTDMTHIDAREHVLPLEIDYVKPLRSGRMELGTRLQRRWIDVSYDVMRGVRSVIYQGLGDASEWREDIYAVYGNYVHERERIAIEAGVRVEQTDVSYDLPAGNAYYDRDDDYDYFDVYPNVRLTYHLTDTDSIAAYYNHRVDRPGEAELRIFPKYDDPELLKVGNPYLRPQFTQRFELGYEHLLTRGALLLSAYYRDIDDPFTRVYDIDPTNPDYDIVNRIYQNVGSGNEAGVELVFSHDLTDDWELSGSVNAYRREIDGDTVTLLFPVVRPFDVAASEDDTWDVSLDSQKRFGNGARLHVHAVYYGARNIAQGTQKARSSVDVGFTLPVLRGKGELAFTVSDLFNDFGIEQRIRGSGFEADYRNYYETQVVSVGLSYEFR